MWAAVISKKLNALCSKSPQTTSVGSHSLSQISMPLTALHIELLAASHRHPTMQLPNLSATTPHLPSFNFLLHLSVYIAIISFIFCLLTVVQSWDDLAATIGQPRPRAKPTTQMQIICKILQFLQKLILLS